MSLQASLGMDMPTQYKRLDPTLVHSDWRAPHPDDWPRFWEAKRVGIDTEFRDPELLTHGVGCRRDPVNHYVFGFSIAVEDGPKVYLPTKHDGGDNLDHDKVVEYLRYGFARFEGHVVGANLACDLDWMWSTPLNIQMPKVKRFMDIQVADPLLYELHRSYRLGDIAKRRGYGGKNEDGLRKAAGAYGIDPKDEMWRLPARHVGPYAEDDGWLPLKILRKQEQDIAAQGLMKAWDLECRLLPILIRMTQKGVRVDLDRVEQFHKWCDREEAAAWATVKRETGVDIPVGEAMNVTLLSRALKAVGLDDVIGENSKGESITKENLVEASKHPVVAAILQARKVAKLVSTYVNSIPQYIIQHGDEWRVHPIFNQIRRTEEAGLDSDGDAKSKGVAYGRLSCSNPNMQNQPAGDRFTGENLVGCRWRSVFLPDKGKLWVAKDLKQQEPRWSFHYGAMLEELRNRDGSQAFPDITGAIELCRQLNENPLLDCYEPLVTMTGKARGVCKIMWLARAYGKGNGNMCEDLGYPTEEWVFVPRKMKSVPVASDEGQRALTYSNHVKFKGPSPEGLKVIEDFDATMPFLKATARLAEQQAKDNGLVKLLSGRRCHFEPTNPAAYDADPDNYDGGFEYCNKAFNRIIQGTSSEQMKETMVAVDDAGYGESLMLQVHDELDSTLESKEEAMKIAEVMKHAVRLRVPTVVDVEVGPSWGESMTAEGKDADGKKFKRPYVWDL
jgi:DNA polymerase I-like protein with 3'-5' exonuclease and polymerase domains